MIRQAISCDICGTEKRQTNHWFVALEQSGEMRLAGWNTRNRIRPGTKHLCGQTCLHKLVDEYMARIIDVRNQSTVEDASAQNRPEVADDSYEDFDTFDAPIVKAAETPTQPVPPEPLTPRRVPPRPSTGIVAMPTRQTPAKPDPPRNPGNWRAEAWNRERDRELRAADQPAEAPARRRSGS